MKKLIDLDNILYYIIGILLAVFCMLATLRTKTSYPILILCMVMYVITILLRNKVIKITNFNFLQIICGILFMLNGFILGSEEGIKFAVYFGIMIIFTTVMQNDSFKISKTFFRLCLIFSLFFVLMTYYQYFNPSSFFSFASKILSPDAIETNKRILIFGAYCGLTGQSQTNGFLISIGIGILITNMFSSSKKNIKIFSLILIMISYYALILTHKRDLILIPVAMILFFFVYTKKFNLKRMLSFMTLIAIMVIIGIILIKNVPEISDAFMRFTVAGSYDGEDVSSGRFIIWAITIRAIFDNPIFGLGVYNSMTLFNGGLPHNSYLQVLCETGLFIGTLIIVMFITGLVISLMNFKKCKNSYSRYILLLSIYCQFLFLLEALTENVIAQATYTSVYLCSLSFALSKKTISRVEVIKKKHTKKVGVI